MNFAATEFCVEGSRKYACWPDGVIFTLQVVTQTAGRGLP
jgi:hypothetical protein